MTNSEIRKELVVEMNKKTPNQTKIKKLNKLLDEMHNQLEAKGVQVFSGCFGEPEPMADAKSR